MDLRQLLAAVAALFLLAAPPQSAASGLPIIEFPPVGGGGDTLAVIYSGDGGWAGFDQGLAEGLARAGVPVVGINSLRYFLIRKSPEQAADDLAELSRDYMRRWGRTRLIVVGFSFGADALPAILPHLTPDLRARMRLVALVGAGQFGDLQFQPVEWLGRVTARGYVVANAARQMQGAPAICIYGDRDTTSSCPALPAAVRRVRLGGGHHLENAYAEIDAVILRAAGL